MGIWKYEQVFEVREKKKEGINYLEKRDMTDKTATRRTRAVILIAHKLTNRLLILAVRR